MFGMEPTPLDMEFRIGRIPVRVHPGFWVVAVIGGWNPRDLHDTLLWVICLFVSILVHELGHAVIAERFGWPSEILLYHFGGLALSHQYHVRSQWPSIAVSMAGPGAGFLLYGLLQIVMTLFHGAPWLDHPDLAVFLRQMKHVNLWWGLVNLAPVMPLDGGQICQSLLMMFRVRNYEYRAARIGLVVGGVISWLFLITGERFAGTLFLFLALQNYTTIQRIRGRW